MAEPMILETLKNLNTRVATNTEAIATNATAISTNKGLFDSHTADDTRHWTTQDRQNFNRIVHFKGYYTSSTALQQAYPTGQTGDYAIVGETDTVWVWDDTTNSWLNSTKQGVVISVNGRTGEVMITKTDVGLSNVDNTSDLNKPVSTAQQTAFNAKADRKLATNEELEGNTLRAGIYNFTTSKTILGYTSAYWTVIVGEDSSSTSGSQLWIDYSSSNEQHCYIRKRNGNTWSSFLEILTSNDLVTITNRISSAETDIGVAQTDIANLKLDRAERKQVTSGQADGFSLKAGIYYLSAEKTINSFTALHWNIIVGDLGTDGSATQTWINYDSNSTIHIFVRRLQDTSGTLTWSSFTEVLTGTQLTQINQDIQAEATARSSADTALTNNKADRLTATSEELQSTTALKAGFYRISNYSYTIGGLTASDWNIIVNQLDDTYAGTQIWMPVTSSAPDNMFIRHIRTSDLDGSKIWGTFKKILTADDFTNLQSQITTNATNIATNTTNIAKKADRGLITLTQADGLDLKAGIYIVSNESKTILGFTSSFWNVYVAQNIDSINKSSSQIWTNIGSSEVSHIYVRHQINSSQAWGDFTEIYTTNHFSSADLSRFKQYKGYFATVSALETAYATANNGDYAIVVDAIYIWNSTETAWVKASGSDDSGKNKWSIKRYDATDVERAVPYIKDLTGRILEKQWEVDDTSSYLINEAVVNNKYFLFETYVNMSQNTDVTTSIEHDDNFSIFLNNIYVSGAENTGTTQVTLHLTQGWNKIQMILLELTGAEMLALGSKISDNTACVRMNCFHSDNDLIQGYVPLVGDSTIDGDVTVTGDLESNQDINATGDVTAGGDIVAGGVVKITENSYIQYNSSDNSLSFIFV